MNFSLTTCCICLEQMKEPIKTLPCLHSSCASCIDGLCKPGEETPFRCPLCRSPFEFQQAKVPENAPPAAEGDAAVAAVAPGASSCLEPNFFTSYILSLARNPEEKFDPNSIICGLCDEKEATEYCADCPRFLCQGCKRPHSKMGPNHQLVSIDEGLKIKDGTSSTSSNRLPHCLKHPKQEVNSYCKECKEACCAECIVDTHSTHQGLIRLDSISQQFKEDISNLANKVKLYDGDLSKAIQEVSDNLVALKKQSKLAEEHVHEVFDKLRLLVDEREAELLAQIRKERDQKNKTLTLQKDELEFLLKGIRDSVSFTEKLVAEGSGTEIAASHKPVTARFETLENEMKKAPLSPLTTEIVDLTGGEKGVMDSKKVIQEVGKIFINDLSPEKSSIVRRDNGNATIGVNQECALDVILVDLKGERVLGAFGPSIQVKVSGPSKDVKVDILEKQGGGGIQSAAYTLPQAGLHEISVLVRGKHFPGSPFQIRTKATIGSSGGADGQFSSPYAVACNSRGEIIVADSSNNRIQVFDQEGKFLFKFNSQENENGQLNRPYGVTVDPRNDNQIVVTDENNRVQVFDERGGFLRQFGSGGNDEGQFSSPRGIAVHQTSGNYFVADYNNHRVQVFDANGGFLRQFGANGGGDGQFQNPTGLGLLSNGNVVVSEYSGNRMQIFDSEGNFVKVIANGEVSNPWHLAVDADDNILVADYSNARVQTFNAEGNFVKTLVNGELSNATGICIDKQGRIIVSDISGQRISIF